VHFEESKRQFLVDEVGRPHQPQNQASSLFFFLYPSYADAYYSEARRAFVFILILSHFDPKVFQIRGI
jgi:hypothetical protein